MYKASIQSIATSFPEKSLSNTQPPFTKIKEISDQWYRFWGVESRHVCDENKNENELALAKKACKSALEKAKKSIQDIDLLLCNSSNPFLTTDGDNRKRMFPRMSGELIKALGGKNILCWDVEVECASFLFQLQIAANFIKQGRYKNVLICSSEYVSSVLDYTSRSSTVFGDGAVAAVLTSDDIGGDWIASSNISISDLYDLATIKWRYPEDLPIESRTPEDFRIYFSLQDNGQEEIAEFIPATLPKMVENVLKKAGLTPNDISCFAFHQPSRVIVDLWANRIGNIEGKYDVTLKTNGCMVSCALPHSFYASLCSGKVKPGDKIVLAGPGTGWGFFAQIWQVGEIKY